MNSASVIDVLSRLSALHNRSLAIYLADAKPWAPGAGVSEEALSELRLLAASHRDTVGRLGTMILDRDGELMHGHFPLRFASYHDLSLSFLLGELATRQETLVEQIQECAAELEGHPLEQAVVEEILGQAKGHLESLRELLHPAHAE